MITAVKYSFNLFDMVVPMATGYYRYTDIWFEWPKACGEDQEAIKAILAHDALCSNEHPLHIDGVDGAQLFIGTLHSGENRLLFSSKQVDYVRYWLYQVGLTKKLVPLPWSNCLLREQDLRGVAPQAFKTGSELREATKQIEKNNKRIKKSNDPPLTFRRKLFEDVRTLFQSKIGCWCSIDLEAWEMEHSMITEFGWSLIRWEDGKEVLEGGHLIVKEYQFYTNTRFVQGNRDHYKFGQSQVVTKKEFKTLIQTLLRDLKKHKHVFLVFHGHKSDIDYLQSPMVQADLTGLQFILPRGSSPQEGVFVVDTADLFGGLLGEGSSSRGLQQMCHQLQIHTEFLHNAGNDAYYTLSACKEMASGDAVDLQRDKRWPGLTPAGTFRVDFDALENEEPIDAASDEEGLYMSALT